MCYIVVMLHELVVMLHELVVMLHELVVMLHELVVMFHELVVMLHALGGIRRWSPCLHAHTFDPGFSRGDEGFTDVHHDSIGELKIFFKEGFVDILV